MTINDFKPGQTVYTLSRTRGRTVEHFIKRQTVVAVGRKYVKVVAEGSRSTANPTEYYLNNETDDYLVENKDWGDKDRLFLTEQAVNDDIEKDMLKRWVNQRLKWAMLDNYSLDQLRAVKEILEDNPK